MIKLAFEISLLIWAIVFFVTIGMILFMLIASGISELYYEIKWRIINRDRKK